MIYTFYSFKGGVGRSMALANVAEILYRRGLRVLIVDFDLEAPGLERYFDVPDARYSADEVLSKRGLIDLLLSYKDLRSLLKPRTERALKQKVVEIDLDSKDSAPIVDEEIQATDEVAVEFNFPVEPLSNFIVPVYEKSTNGGELSIIPAGSRAKELYNREEGSKDEFVRYAERVRSFAWDDFYANWDGEKFFAWFLAEARTIADVVLIDSRTGVTEMSGVCTYHLPDAVVMFVTPNFQNLNGTLMIANSLNSPRLITEGRKGRPLSLLFVPSRVESGEGDKLDDFAMKFEQLFDFIRPSHLKFKDGAFIDLKVPYVPYYAYVEDVASRVLASRQPKAADLIRAFEKLAETLAQLSAPQSKLFKRYHPESGDDQSNRTAEEAFARLTTEEQKLAESIFTRLIQIGSAKDSSHDTFLRAPLTDFEKDEQKVLRTLSDYQLVIIEKEQAAGEDVVRVADETLIRQWQRLSEFLEKNRRFLHWRQQLQVSIEQWEQSKRDKTELLSGNQLTVAERWQERKETRLNDTENYYINLSMRNKSQKRWRDAGVIAGVAVAVLITVFGWYQTSRQQRQDREKAQDMAFFNKETGDKSANSGDLQSAVNFYNSAVNLNPDYAEAINGRGKAFLALGQLDEAIKDFERVIELKPDFAEAFLNRGIAYLSKDDPAKAIADLNAAITLEPQNAVAYFSRANALSKKGLLDNAITDYGQAITLNHDYIEAYYNRAIAYKTKFDKDTNATEFKDSAVSDLIHVIVATNVPGMKTDADRLRQELLGQTTSPVEQAPTPQPPQVYLHYNDSRDAQIINAIVENVRKNGIAIVAMQTEGATAGDIRYYYAEDKPNAAKIRQLVTSALGRNTQITVRLIFLGNYYKNVDRGNIEVWIPSLSTGVDASPLATPATESPR